MPDQDKLKYEFIIEMWNRLEIMKGSGCFKGISDNFEDTLKIKQTVRAYLSSK